MTGIIRLLSRRHSRWPLQLSPHLAVNSSQQDFHRRVFADDVKRSAEVPFGAFECSHTVPRVFSRPEQDTTVAKGINRGCTPEFVEVRCREGMRAVQHQQFAAPLPFPVTSIIEVEDVYGGLWESIDMRRHFRSVMAEVPCETKSQPRTIDFMFEQFPIDPTMSEDIQKLSPDRRQFRCIGHAGPIVSVPMIVAHFESQVEPVVRSFKTTLAV